MLRSLNLKGNRLMGKKWRSIDLFAGIGGIRLGFDRAFGEENETVFVSEWDSYAQKTYAANKSNNPKSMFSMSAFSF